MLHVSLFFVSKIKCNSFGAVVVWLILSSASQLKQKRAGGSKETNFFSSDDYWEDPGQAWVNNYNEFFALKTAGCFTHKYTFGSKEMF